MVVRPFASRTGEIGPRLLGQLLLAQCHDGFGNPGARPHRQIGVRALALGVGYLGDRRAGQRAELPAGIGDAVFLVFVFCRADLRRQRAELEVRGEYWRSDR